MNGRIFEVAGLKDGESRTISVASAMQPGDANTIAVEARGRPGGTADVVIHE